MAERRIEVLWAPQDTNQFLTWGSDIRVYRTVYSSHHPRQDWEQIGPHRYAELVQCITEPRRYIKCVDIARGDTAYLAVGQSNGKVSLLNLSGSKCFENEGNEFNPRQSHGCTSLSWHPHNHSFLAAGFEKLRTEHGVLVWDLSQDTKMESPVCEAANGEYCCSLAWIPNNNNLLVTGLGLKSVKIFDTRTNVKAVKQTMTKATYGLCVDPWSEYRICGYSEIDPSIVTWDTRNFEKPTFARNTSQQISKVSWCPTRQGLLANSYKDSGCIILHDIMNWPTSQEEGEASVIDRSIQPPCPNIGNILDFAWHPRVGNTLLAMASNTNMGSGNRFCEWTVSDRLTLNWSARHSLVWSLGSRLDLAVGEHSHHSPGEEEGQGLEGGAVKVEDISVVMQHRAKLGYAKSITLADLSKYDLNSELHTTWTWILNSSLQGRFQGIGSILDQSHSMSRVRQSTWAGLENVKSVRTYTSSERDQVLNLCGWKRDRCETGEGATMSEIIRSAAINIFNLNMKQALQVLRGGAAHFTSKEQPELANQLNMVSLAVSGYSSDGSSLWKDVVAGSLSLLPSPVLKSVFSFLAGDDDTYKEVLNPDNLQFVDRMAVAHIFLSDTALKDFLEKEWNNFVLNGRLEGLLISKSHSDSVKIIQAFVDRTGDLQTACWVALYTFPPDIIKSDKIIELLENYKTMLDRWNMFGARSDLDVTLTNKDPSWDTLVPVYVACNFCGKSISNSGRRGINKTGSLTRQATGQQNKSKAQACPSCRKPMPRCAICLVNMGTMSGLSAESKSSIVTKFDDWLTWCQTCRHGGHAQHLLEWFTTHSVCAVTGCGCKCGALDATSV